LNGFSFARKATTSLFRILDELLLDASHGTHLDMRWFEGM
jgi:hypothetical protein